MNQQGMSAVSGLIQAQNLGVGGERQKGRQKEGERGERGREGKRRDDKGVERGRGGSGNPTMPAPELGFFYKSACPPNCPGGATFTPIEGRRKME